MVEILAALIAVSEAILFPSLVFFASSITLDYLSRHFVHKQVCPLDIVMANIAYRVRSGFLEPYQVQAELDSFNFSQFDKKMALSILKRTDFLRILDITFDDDDHGTQEQILFTFSLAAYVYSTPSFSLLA